MINVTIRIFSLLIQIASTIAICWCVYMLLVLFEYEGGIDALISTTLFQPLIGGFVAAITAFVCYIAGLPIRLNRRLRDWWVARPFLPLAGIIVGISLVTLSTTPYFTESITLEDENLRHIAPNASMGIAGWLLLSFSLMHFFPLEYLQKRLPGK